MIVAGTVGSAAGALSGTTSAAELAPIGGGIGRGCTGNGRHSRSRFLTRGIAGLIGIAAGPASLSASFLRCEPSFGAGGCARDGPAGLPAIHDARNHALDDASGLHRIPSRRAISGRCGLPEPRYEHQRRACGRRLSLPGRDPACCVVSGELHEPFDRRPVTLVASGLKL